MITAEEIQDWDQRDKLRKYHDAFVHPEPGLIYLDGNSLGRITVAGKQNLYHTIEYQWSERLIRSWNEGWYELGQKLSAQLAKIIGAKPHEVMIADNTSVNLFKLAIAALRLKKDRKQVVSDELNFPTDLYILQGVIDLLDQGHHLELMKSKDGMSLSADEVEQNISENTALLTLSQVVFKSAYLYPMQQINEMAIKQGALVLWDLSHSVGAVPVELSKNKADLAIGCTYKFLNGGPGSPAFVYVSERLQSQIKSPIWGWFGAASPFDFTLQYRAAEGASQYATGTPPILSLAALEPSLDLILEAGMENIRQKSIQLTELIKNLATEYLVPLGFIYGSPMDASKRGSHFSLRHPEAYRICQALISAEVGAQVVIPDFRAPDNIRLGVNPLYNSFEDVFKAVFQIKEIVEKRLYQNFSSKATGVT